MNNSDFIVTAINLDSVNVRGNKAFDLLKKSNAELSERKVKKWGENGWKVNTVKTVVLHFKNYKEQINFLQKAVDLGWLFSNSDFKMNTAYQHICTMKQKNEIIGNIKEFMG